MLNQVLLVGSIASEIEYDKYDDGSRKISLDLLVSNPNGKEDSDQIIPLVLSGKIALISGSNLKKGMTIGVKATLSTKSDLIEVKVDKLTFISTEEVNYN